MEILLIRAALAPTVVLAVSLVARRVGPRRGGQLMGLPLTTCPFLIVVCEEYGADVAARSACGSLSGQLAVAIFCLAYARFAPGGPGRAWPVSIALAGVGGVAATAIGITWIVAATAIALGLAVRATSGTVSGPVPLRTERSWDLPFRMSLSGATVVASLLAGQALGSYVAGVVASLPIVLAVLLPSLHRSSGADAAVDLARGTLASVCGTVAFLLVLSVTLVPLGLPVALGVAACALVAVEGSLRTTVDRRPPSGSRRRRPCASAMTREHTPG